MKEQQQDLNPLELINPQETSPELAEFAREGYRRGHLRFADFKDMRALKSKFFTYLVTIHELGHDIVARARGWVVKSFNNTGGPGYAGMVVVAPPTGISYGEYLESMGVIAAAGQEALGDNMGAGSDDAQVEAASSIIGTGKSRFHSTARGLLPGRSVLKSMAWSKLPA